MGNMLAPITGFFKDMNYVYAVEILVILAIISLLCFIFYSLGLFNKASK